MIFLKEEKALIARRQGETLRIEAWGTDSLRVRATMYPEFTGQEWALTEKPSVSQPKIEIGTQTLRAGEAPAEDTYFYPWYQPDGVRN